MALASTSVHVVECASQNDCRQRLCHQGELLLPPASLGDFPDQQVGLTQAPFKSLLPWVPELVRFCVHPLSIEAISLSPLGLPKVRPAGWPSRACLPDAGPPGQGADVGLRPLTPLGELLQF